MTEPRQLFPFQEEGVQFLDERGGGFLWDQPGLGKTTQAIVAAKKLTSDGVDELDGPILVVCPNSLKLWWAKEIKELYPDDSILVAESAGRLNGHGSVTQLYLSGRAPDWVIVHYAGVRISQEDYAGVPWSVVVADECHYIKNRKAERTKALIAITPKYAYRIGLTATPYSQEPSGLWSQLRWMMPDDQNMRSYWKFYERFVDYRTVPSRRTGRSYRKVAGGRNLEQLAQIMSGYGIRRTKKEVAPQLPPLTRTRMPIKMTEKQREVYNRLKREDGVEFQYVNQNGEIEHMVIKNALARMTRLEQWLSHPWTFLSSEIGAKMAWLKDYVESTDQPLVIATRFKESAKAISKAFDDCGQAITGDLSTEEREEIAEAWKGGETRILVGTIATIGTGLSFERANTLIVYDQVHSTIQMEQLDHRVHRITSRFDTIEVVYVHCDGTTNELILDAFTEKFNQIELVRRFLAHIQEGKQ